MELRRIFENLLKFTDVSNETHIIDYKVMQLAGRMLVQSSLE